LIFMCVHMFLNDNGEYEYDNDYGCEYDYANDYDYKHTNEKYIFNQLEKGRGKPHVTCLQWRR